MIPVYILHTVLWNGTIKQMIDTSVFLSRDTARKVKSAVDKANENSGSKVTTELEEACLYTHERTIPILNPDEYDSKYGFPGVTTHEDLQAALTSVTVAALKASYNKDVDAVEFRADGLQESVEAGTWVPGTDSSVSVYSKEGDCIGTSI